MPSEAMSLNWPKGVQLSEADSPPSSRTPSTSGENRAEDAATVFESARGERREGVEGGGGRGGKGRGRGWW